MSDSHSIYPNPPDSTHDGAEAAQRGLRFSMEYFRSNAEHTPSQSGEAGFLQLGELIDIRSLLNPSCREI